ncbi:sensor histidine kinase [Jongsikchunia kroppenstedtii]|uniref:sensor histidine kinase n=1 Tax=Jongsikchunia kroppenstedtii TaxID=1121721 RepID=UPI00037396D0|nr:sensor histidine kinase [Jongsikchunia kroppenstedtii]
MTTEPSATQRCVAENADPERGGVLAEWLRGAWHDRRWIFAAIWLVFLIYPIASVVKSDHSLTAKIIGLVLLGLFALTYTVVCMMAMFGPEYAGPRPRRVGASLLGTLVVIVAALVPVLQQDVFGLAPYLMACAVFAVPNLFRDDESTRWRAGLVGYGLVILIVGSALVIPELVPGWSLDSGTVATLLVVGVVMPAMRAMQIRETQREELARRQRAIDERMAVVAERERVARDVHDVLGHSLTVLTVKSELAERLVDIDSERAKAELADMQRIARSALSEVRATVGGLRAPSLASELLAARTALSAAQIDPELPVDVEVVDEDMQPLFAWVLREAVTNVVRHSGAAHCRVVLERRRISVVDDGSGFTGSVGNGLRGLIDRVHDVGGRLDVGPGEPAGTRLVVTG